MDRSDTIARHTFTIFLVTFAMSIIRYLFKISMARMLDVRGCGLISAVEPIIIFTASLTLTGFASALSKYLSEEMAKDNRKTAENYVSTALFYIFPLSIVVTIIVFFLSGFIAQTVFREPDLTILIQIIILVLPVEALWLVIDGLFMGLHESPYYTYCMFVYNVVMLAAAVLLVMAGFDAKGAVTGILIGDISGLIVAYIVYIKKIKKRISLSAGKQSFVLLKKLVNFAVPKTVTSVSMLILMSFDIFCITYFLGVVYAGLYNAAVPIARMTMTISLSIAIPLLPAISEDTARNKEYLQTYLTDALRYTFAATIPLVILFVFYAKEFIIFFFGEPYSAASTALMILSIAMLLRAFFSIFSVTFQGIGKPQTPMKIAVFAVFFNVALNIYLIPREGINGAAFATLVSMVIQFVYLTFKINDYADYNKIKSDIFKIGVLSLVLIVIVLIFKSMFLLGTTIGLAVYALLLIKSGIIDIKKFIPL
jgi:O-antigen/teichoic acid export membrane protein